MILLEYEAKQLLREHGLATPVGRLLRAGDTLDDDLPVVVKAQVPVGGRGKAGGVKVARTASELVAARDALLGQKLLGHVAASLLVEELLEPARELYVAVALDRAEQAMVLLAHHSGGVDIGHAARRSGGAFKVALRGEPSRQVAGDTGAYLGLPPEQTGELHRVMAGLWQISAREDAVLVEINPLMVLPDGRMICADAKIELDDAAVFRHSGRNFETQPASAQFVVLSQQGTVASLANGAGLAMATNDAIQAAGAEPANFYDVGGGTDAAEMTRGFDRIRELPGVRAIVVNIFGGITRCDEVAEAILAARAANIATPPVFIRLEGTNAAEGSRMLKAAGIELWPSLGQCVEQAVAQVRHV